MNIKFENNAKWTAKEKKKIKKRAITITVLLSLIVISTASIFTVNYIRKTKGLFYPSITLQDAVTGTQPQILPAEGYEQVLKAPTMPYTLLTKGEVVTDSDAFCIFLTDGMYAAVAEIPKNAETCQYIKTAIMPSLNGSVSEITSFKKQVGYLNERQVESQGTTITLNNGTDVYAMNIRVYLPYEKDILISVISSSTNMKNAEEIAENIFYSLRQLEDSQESVNSDTSNANGITDIEDIEEYYSLGDATDFDEQPGTCIGDPYIDTYTTQWEISNDNGYIDGETYTFDIGAVTNEGSDSEWLYFGYYLSWKQLKKIALQDAEGNTYYPDELRKSAKGYLLYGFNIGKGKTGEWTVVWTADDSIGQYIVEYATTKTWKTALIQDMIYDY